MCGKQSPLTMSWRLTPRGGDPTVVLFLELGIVASFVGTIKKYEKEERKSYVG